MNLLLVCLGGSIGAVCRYLMGLSIQKRFPHPAIPIAMLSVNLLGSLGLGLFLGIVYDRIPLNAYHDPLYLYAGIGFFGAFTTFSTFSIETITLVQQKKLKQACAYFSISILGSIGMFLVGFWVV